MSELTLDQLAAGIQAQFGAISDDISLLRAQVKQVRDTFLRSTLTDVETTVNTVNTTTATINTTTGTTSTNVSAVQTGLGTLTPDTITPFSTNSLGPILAAVGNAVPDSGTWQIANRAVVAPFSVTISVTVYKLFVHNGLTVSGNFDIGIYNSSYAKLISTGATAQAGTDGIQVVDVADTVLAPGTYYLALAFDNVTATTYRSAWGAFESTTIAMRAQTSAYTLPATLAPNSSNTSGVVHVPIFGAALRSDLT